MRFAPAFPLAAALGAALALPTLAGAQSQPTPSTSATEQPQQLRQSRGADSAQASALGVLSAINTGEINAGRLAVTQASDARTQRYAQHMIDEHTDNNLKLARWEADVMAPPAKAKAAEATRTLAMLQQAKGAAFDGAYLKTMVRDHQAALRALDSSLIPAAHDAAVSDFLKTTRTHVADHLQQAQQLLEQMTGKAAEAQR